jgi:hypothetical protein
MVSNCPPLQHVFVNTSIYFNTDKICVALSTPLMHIPLLLLSTHQRSSKRFSLCHWSISYLGLGFLSAAHRTYPTTSIVPVSSAGSALDRCRCLPTSQWSVKRSFSRFIVQLKPEGKGDTFIWNFCYCPQFILCTQRRSVRGNKQNAPLPHLTGGPLNSSIVAVSVGRRCGGVAPAFSRPSSGACLRTRCCVALSCSRTHKCVGAALGPGEHSSPVLPLTGLPVQEVGVSPPAGAVRMFNAAHVQQLTSRYVQDP